MKVSASWLREWVNPVLSPEELYAKLTMAGLEVESVTPVAEKFSSVVIAEIRTIEKHPEADRLQICQVNIGQEELLTIVCGATNIKIGMKVPAALVGAVLPNNMRITRSKLRGVVSNGMLCSGRELTLLDDSNGIFEFSKNAPIGQDVWDYLNLSDDIIDISITPNRGDCLSIQGLSKEIAAITESKLINLSISETKAVISDELPITIDAPDACPHYVGRVITQVNANAETPVYLKERLCRAGIRSISAIVDIMNYVMLELGQPLHAFDLQKISDSIHVRMAKPLEELVILDGQTIQLDSETLVIADSQKPIAIAGVMGGLESGVSSATHSIFIESAFFNPKVIARTRQKYHLGSESSYRFERGIDPTQQRKAIERATELICWIAGGQPGSILDKIESVYLPPLKKIPLRAARIQKILGFLIEDSVIEAVLIRLGCVVEKNKAIATTTWQVTVPAYRTDIALEIDLIEEIIRLYGYQHIPLHQTIAPLAIQTLTSTKNTMGILRQSFCHLGYQEAITYSFIDPKRQQLFDPDNTPLALLNPMTVDMSVMRTQLWPGLVDTLLYNQNRQQSRVRLFEIGLRFVPDQLDSKNIVQQRVISGLINGTIVPQQWGSAARPVDYFDLKGDLENSIQLLLPTVSMADVLFKPSQHSALHPGQAADIYYKSHYLGVFGALHPSIVQELGIVGNVFVFELFLDALEGLLIAHTAHRIELSKFPEIRRDIAIYVDQTVPSQQIQDTIVEVSGSLLKEVNVFDVYQGKGVPPNHKSIALTLILQHASRTLLDQEVADIIVVVLSALKQRFAAELRG